MSFLHTLPGGGLVTLTLPDEPLTREGLEDLEAWMAFLRQSLSRRVQQEPAATPATPTPEAP